MSKYNKQISRKVKHQMPTEEYKNIFKDTHDPNCSYTLRFDPYGKGCYYNCKYCYSRNMQINRQGWFPNSPKVANWDKIVKVVQTKLKPGTVLRLGGMTDCFQPIELRHRLTYKLIKLFNRKNVHYLILTKSPLVIRDEYLKIFDKNLAHFQISIPTTDDNFTKMVSKAPTFDTMKNVVETLYQKGFDASVRCSPFLYNTIDFDKYNSIDVEKCLVEFLRVSNRERKWIKKYIDISEYTHNEFDSQYTFNYSHLPLEKKLEAISKLDFPQLNVCEEVPSHELYFREHVNYNPYQCCNMDLPKEVLDKYEVHLVDK